ncbi:MAG: ATP phosphoribosyltransferase regulatory subunit [Gammaproteobacteria bacterium]
MSLRERWLLPDGIEEVLPPEADALEALRRGILDQFRGWGYELVIPPLVEYLESLLTGMSDDLDLQTFKLIDQLTGRMMGVRADMTPQVARIDAHRLNRNVPTRLCYLGTVLHARPSRLDGARSPMQVGAELYGHSGVASDVEIIRLMLATLNLAGIEPVYIELGHMGVFRGLAVHAGLEEEQQSILFALLQRKASTELSAQLRRWKLPPRTISMIVSLLELEGDLSVLRQARKALRGAPAMVARALAEMTAVGNALRRQSPDLRLHVDLAELRGYHYHTGIMFAAYQPGRGQALALGGRYDNLGKVFGRGRAATGFSADLRALLSGKTNVSRKQTRILAPANGDERLHKLVGQLRARGNVVVYALPGERASATDMNCDRRIVRAGGRWTIRRVQ